MFHLKFDCGNGKNCIHCMVSLTLVLGINCMVALILIWLSIM